MTVKHARNQGRSAIVEDVKLFWSNSSDYTARLGAITTENASEMKLYIILATLENFEHKNQTILSSRVQLVQCSPAIVGFS